MSFSSGLTQSPKTGYGRALYMSMELAGRRIPTSAQYPSGWLRPSADVSAGGHLDVMVNGYTAYSGVSLTASW